MLRRLAFSLAVLLALMGGVRSTNAQEAPAPRIELPDAMAEPTAGQKAAANQTCTEEPLEPGIRFGFGGNVTNTGTEESTGVEVTYTMDGVAEFVTGTENAEKGTWSTVTAQQLVLNIAVIAPGDVVEVTFDVQSLGEGTATYTLQGINDSGTFAQFTCDFIFGQPSSAGLSGLKWNDANGNGQFDDGEEGLSGWTLELNTGQTTTTDANGAYSFPDLEPGEYTVSEAQQDGWMKTFPSGGSHTVTLESGDFAEGLNFGNELTNPGTITGVKWNDANGNGTREEDEQGLEGWTIELNGGTQTTTTGPDGGYTFTGLAPGEYTVSEVQQDGWTQTYPGQGGTHTVALGPGDEVFRSFGNRQDGLRVSKNFYEVKRKIAPLPDEDPLLITEVNSYPILSESLGTLKFVISVTNTSSIVAKNVILEDGIPPGLLVRFSNTIYPPLDRCEINLNTIRCELGDLAPQTGQEVAFDAGSSEAGSFVNTATAVSDNLPGDEDSASIELYDPFEKTSGTADPAEQTVDQGSESSVSFTITNTSNDELFIPVTFRPGVGLAFLNASSPDAECGENDDGEPVCATNLEGGESFAADITFEATEAGTFDIWANVGDYTIATSTVTVEGQNEADVALEAMDTGLPIVGGLYVTEATVVNQGPDLVGRLDLTVDYPIDQLQLFSIRTEADDEDTECTTETRGDTETVTCIMTEMQPDEERAVFVTSRVMVAEEGTEVEVTGSTQTDEDTTDPNDENNTFSLTTSTTETPPTDLEITKSGNTEAVEGDTLWYNMLVENIGANPAEGVQIVDIPFMEGTPGSYGGILVDEVTTDPAGSCATGFLGVFVCDLGTLASGENAMIGVPVIPPGTGTLRNRAQVFSFTTEANLMNNEDVVETEVLPEGLVVEKTVEEDRDFFAEVDFFPSFEAVITGTPLTFDIEVRNTSQEAAQNVIVEDELPTGFVDIAASGPGCSVTANVVRCEVGTIEPGQRVFVGIDTPPEAAGTFTNTATAVSDNLPGDDGTADVRVEKSDETVSSAAEPSDQGMDVGGGGSVEFTLTNEIDTDLLTALTFRIGPGLELTNATAIDGDGACEDVDASKEEHTELLCLALADSSGSTRIMLDFEAVAPGTHQIAVDVGDFTDAAISTVTVEEVAAGPLCGQKFVDLDGDGEHDDDEPGLDGVTIELLDASGSLVASEKTGTEDRDGDDAIDPFAEKGRFCFEDLSPGTYTVREVQPLAFTQTFPAGAGTHTVELTGEAEPPPVLFGNAPVLDPPPEDVPLDYGDLPDPRADVTCPPGVCYPTLLGNDGPRHVIDPDGPHLGATIDADPNGQPDATALGDDALDGSDDEDGLVSSSIQADGSIQFEIDATVPANATAFVDAWIDLNDDGVLDTVGPGVPPPPEHVLVRQPVVNGGNTLTTAPGLVDPEDQLGYTRLRISSTGVAFPSGVALDGEVEDYVRLGADFGDAPGAIDPDRPAFPGGYPTTLAQNGARHVAHFNTRLGDHIDADDQVDGAFDAREDDDDDPENDEDGIRFLTGFTEETHPDAGAHVGVVPGTTAELLPLPSVEGQLDAWIDWNRDGDWDDAGEQVFASEDIGPQMTEDDALTVAVPEDAAPGFTYARFRFSRLGGLTPAGAAPSGEVEDYLVRTANVLNVAVQRSFGDGSTSQNYRLVALPGAVDLPLAQTLSGDPGVQWQGFWDDGSDADFLIPFDGSETFTFRPGRGFWLISTAPWAVEATVDAVPLDADSVATVPVHEGWNIISNPFGRDVRWTDVSAANGGALQALWQWDGAFSVADTFRTAIEGDAFYFLNDASLDALSIPYPTPVSVKSSVAHPAAERPVLILMTKQAGTRTSEVRIGMDPEAEMGIDALDQFAPPGRFEGATLRLQAPDTGQSERLRYLAHEWRPPGAGHTFALILHPSPNAPDMPVTISVAGAEAFAKRHVVLINTETGRANDLKARSTLRIQPDSEGATFTLAIGSEDFVAREQEKVLPESIALHPGYPNPARESLTVTYALPAPTDVRLIIYDVLGRRVRVLSDGAQPAGRHRIRWAGRNDAGQPVASGLYLIRLEAGGQQHVRKVTLIR